MTREPWREPFDPGDLVCLDHASEYDIEKGFPVFHAPGGASHMSGKIGRFSTGLVIHMKPRQTDNVNRHGAYDVLCVFDGPIVGWVHSSWLTLVA